MARPSQTPLTGTSTTTDWRLSPGYISEHGGDFESSHILMGYFLRDTTSPNPLPEKSLVTAADTFDWGELPILEKVVRSEADLAFLATHPSLLCNSIAIVEPWEHVGQLASGEPVRASKNIAYIAQRVADADSILFPIWSTGTLKLDVLVPLMTSGLAVVFEGGDPSVQHPASFSHPECPRDDVFALVEKLLLSRSPNHAPSIFICLGHQLACECLIRLLRRAVDTVLQMGVLDRDTSGHALATLQMVCRQIQTIGEGLNIHKRDGRVGAVGWCAPTFCVTRNEMREVGTTRLLRYQAPDSLDIPTELIQSHNLVADELEGIIDTMLAYESDVHISMFHGDEVNEAAVLFANWALQLLHNAIVPYRAILAGSALAWLIQLPYAVEILASTATDGELLTECAATCISYKDFETKRIRRSFTIQFHPELLADLRDFGARLLLLMPSSKPMMVSDFLYVYSTRACRSRSGGTCLFILDSSRLFWQIAAG